MRRLSILLLLLFLVSCSRISGVEVIKEGHIKEDQVQVYTIEKEQIPRDYAYVQDDNVILKDDDGSIVRRLFFQERVFVYRKRSGQVLIMDQYGNSGWVGQEHLSKQFVSDIAIPLEGVYYASFTAKDRPRSDYILTKGIYIAPNGDDFLYRIVSELKGTPINTIVLDVIDDEGQVLFDSETTEKVIPEAFYNLYSDGHALISKLKEDGYYLIARVATFKNSIYSTKYPESSLKDENGNKIYSDGGYWVSPFDRDYWRYLLGVSNEILEMGFDEIQFDFIRFPDYSNIDYGSTNEFDENRAEAIQKFLVFIKAYINDNHKIISADVVGRSAIEKGDANIGQHWEAISNVVDVISPMIYPQHFGYSYFGAGNEESEPYRATKEIASKSIARNANIKSAAIIRPWIQAWDYSIDEVNEQIKALEGLGIKEYLLWNMGASYPINGFNY